MELSVHCTPHLNDVRLFLHFKEELNTVFVIQHCRYQWFPTQYVLKQAWNNIPRE